jgi:hypothetical protein
MNTKIYSPLTCYQNPLGDDQTNATLDALHIILFHDLTWVGVWGTIPGKRGNRFFRVMLPSWRGVKRVFADILSVKENRCSVKRKGRLDFVGLHRDKSLLLL